MATASFLDRREFLRKSASGGAALVIGLYLPGKYEALAGVPPKDPTAINAWVHIAADDHVTLLIDKSEMGQGISTALAMILAEELDLDWKNFARSLLRLHLRISTRCLVCKAPGKFQRARIVGTFGEDGSGGARNAGGDGGEALGRGAVRLPHGKQHGGEFHDGEAPWLWCVGGRGCEAARAGESQRKDAKNYKLLAKRRSGSIRWKSPPARRNSGLM